MKMNFTCRILLVEGMLLLSQNALFSQADWNTAGNVISGGEFLGATPGSIIPLELKTIPALAINFTTNNIQRGTILPNGFWGICNGAFTPQSKLHINGGLIFCCSVY